MMFEPMLLTMLRTLSSRPRPMEETPMTMATPITIPSTVSDERSLLPRIVSVAIWTISPNSSLRIISLHLEAQGDNRIQFCCFACGIDSKEHSHTGRHNQSRCHCPQFDSGGHADQQGNRFGDGDPQQHSERATHHRQRHRLNQELQQNVSAAGAQRLSYTDFAGALGYGYQHDVHNDDPAHNQRDTGNADRGDKECAAEVRPDT